MASACAAALLAAVPAHAAPNTRNDQARSGKPGVERVSLAADGAQADGRSGGAVLSGNGRYAAFWSYAPNLGGDYFATLHVRDLRTGKPSRVPLAAGYYGGRVSLSDDGRYVGYSAGARYPNPYVYDRKTGTTQHLRPSDPPAGSEISELAALSGDGGHALYTATNRHGNAPRVLFLRDTAAGTDELITDKDADGRYPWAYGAALSRDGGTVLYGIDSRSAPDPDHVFARDRSSGTVRMVDTAPDGTPGDGSAAGVDLSADGRYALFDSAAGNLVPDAQRPPGTHAYLRDLRTGEVRRVGEYGARAASLSGDGHRALLREESGLVLLDLRSGKRTPVGPADGAASEGSVDRHGKRAAFTSAAADLVPDDTNGVADAFVRRR